MAEKTEGRRLFELAADAEFEIEVANQMGPFGRRAIDATRASAIHIPQSSGTKGFYIPKGETKIPEDIANMMRDSHRLTSLLGIGIRAEDDRVYATVPGASNYVWAHEFRHRAEPGALGLSEIGNRLWDAWRARTPAEWQEAVELYRNWQYAKEGRDLTLEEAETELDRRMEESKHIFLRMEAEAMKEQNMPVPNDIPTSFLRKLLGIGPDPKVYLERQYQQRKLARSLK